METKLSLCGGNDSVVKVQMLFERRMSEYEVELSRSEEENERPRRLQDAIFNPEVRIQRADVQQQLVVKKDVPPEQHDWSSSLDQKDPQPPHIKEEQEDPELRDIKEEQEDPEPPHIKEEQEDSEPIHIKEEQEDPEPPHIKEEHLISQEGKQLKGMEEAGIKFSFTPVKSEDDDDDGEEAQSSQLHPRQTEEMETEADGADCVGSEPDTNKTEDSYEPETDENDDSCETDDSRDWKACQEPQSGSNPLQNNEVHAAGWNRSSDSDVVVVPKPSMYCAVSWCTSNMSSRHLCVKPTGGGLEPIF
ncbi:uncharacterized protein [Clinocottus analis]|uniref:uncharacterized protein isoform X3 n=1 Tax=Clinocottus analis TaxID=304258 RepID=UPI0035C14639